MITIPTREVSVRCPIAVEGAETLLGVLMALDSEHGGNLQLDPLLQDACGQFRDQLTGRAAIE